VSTRARVLTLGVGERLVTETCYSCGVLFAMVEDFWEHRQNDRKNFFCPNGHSQAYIGGKSDAQKLRDAEARETHLQDQLRAAVRDAEASRVELIRARSRFANGVCPCCDRYFDNVRRHMVSQHPDQVEKAKAPVYRCSCGYKAGSFHGLRVHQGKSRPENWDDPKVGRYWSHLTDVGAGR
jgi:hypothetical protein